MDRTLNVAFSAYLDHDEDGLGPKETLIFNQILLHEGNGYNNYTGVFTVPITGVYSFTFFIGKNTTNLTLHRYSIQRRVVWKVLV